MPSTTVNTLCFHTRDAVARTEGSFTFELPHGRLTAGATRVQLGSCEFPMTQQTVETDWNRLYVQHGIRLGKDDNILTLLLRKARGETVEQTVGLPPRLNPAKVTSRTSGGDMVIETRLPHHLHDDSGVLLGIDRAGDIPLKGCSVRVLTPTSFRVSGRVVKGGSAQAAGSDSESDMARGGVLYTPTLASGHALAAALTGAASASRPASGDPPVLRFAYEAAEDRIAVTVRAPRSSTFSSLQFSPTRLSSLLGIGTGIVTFASGGERVEVPTAPTRLWDFVELSPGFYGPCNRPMCVGPPLSFPQEAEQALNRLYFPAIPPRQPQQGQGPDVHAIVMGDDEGHVLLVPFPAGRYTPTSMAALLTVQMTAVMRSVHGNASLDVSFNSDDRYVFSCERKVNGVAIPMPFCLYFQHPLSTEAARFGFSTQPYVGLSSYASTSRIRVNRDPMTGGYAPQPIVRINELKGRQRFRFQSMCVPAMMAEIVRYDEDAQGAQMLVRTYVNRRPFACGAAHDDAFVVSAIDESVQVGGEDAPPLKPTAFSTPSSCTCFAMFHRDLPCDAMMMDVSSLPSQVRFALKPGSVVQLTPRPEPISFNFSLEKSVPYDVVGFRRGTIAYDRDGTVADGTGRSLPPFETTAPHRLDHPDYILIHFSERSGTSLMHTRDGETTDIFCKMTLYPTFREARMLPRDTMLARDNFVRFTLSFTNPNGAPYHFNGAEFSFALNFVSDN